MPLIDKVVAAVTGHAAEGASKVIDSISHFFNTPEQKQAYELHKDEMVQVAANEWNRHDEVIAQNVIKVLDIEIQDIANARAMQIAALQQEDKLSKHFVYYLSAFVVLSATAFGVMLFWVDFPESNRRLVEMFSDIYLFAGAIMVLNFFLGSSSGSKRNADAVRNIAEKTTDKL